MNANFLKKTLVTIALPTFLLLSVQLYADCSETTLRNIVVPLDTTINCGILTGTITCQSPETSVLENLTIADNAEVINCKMGKNVVLGKDVVFSDTQDLQAQTCRAQQIDIKTIPDTTFSAKVKGEALTLVTTGGTSGNPIHVTVTTPKICSLQGDQIKLLKEGRCQLLAEQAGNAQYTAAPPTSYIIHVQSKKPSFTFTEDSDSTLKLVMTAAAEDVGKPAIIYVWSNYSSFFKDNNSRHFDLSTLTAYNQWIPWSGHLNYLAPSYLVSSLPKGDITFSMPNTISLVDDSSNQILHTDGITTDSVQATYQLLDESINIPSEITPKQTNFTHCLYQLDGVLYQDQCFRHSESLGGGFYGGIYLFEYDQWVKSYTPYSPEALNLKPTLNLKCSSIGKVAIPIRLETLKNDDIGQAFEITVRAERDYQYNRFSGIYYPMFHKDKDFIHEMDEEIAANMFVQSVISWYNDLDKFTQSFKQLPPVFMKNLFFGELPAGTWKFYFGYRTVGKKGVFGEWQSSTKPLIISVGERCY